MSALNPKLCSLENKVAVLYLVGLYPAEEMEKQMIEVSYLELLHGSCLLLGIQRVRVHC